jgi:hypothetical protein
MNEASEKGEPPKKAEPREEAFRKLFNWASQLTAESSEEEGYLWPVSMKKLLERLKLSKGVLVGVLGLRGVGKSSAMQVIADALRQVTKSEDEVLGLKWPGGDILDVIRSDELTYSESADSYIVQTFMDMVIRDGHFASKILRGGAGEGRFSDEIGNCLWNLASSRKPKPGTHDLLMDHIDIVKGFLPVRVIKECEREAAESPFEKAKWILIDMPDYPKRDPRRIGRDIETIQKIWNRALLSESNPNIVLFIQAETFATEDHFFFGKLLIYRIEPFKPEELIQHFKAQFGPAELVTDEALSYVAKLSRGIFRRFKRFLGVCLEEYLVSGDRSKPMDREFAARALTVDELFKEMDLELSELFKTEEMKENAVKIIRMLMKAKMLMKDREIQQRQLSRSLDMSEGSVSKILIKLEDHGYCTRERQALPEGGSCVIVQSSL